jgi:itaconate CoA-transferase
MSTPLGDITVVALEQAVAAPFATRQLADLGARVIKIERPNTGDFARRYDTVVHGMASHFVWLNRSKQSVMLDIKTPEGAEALERLLERADVASEIPASRDVRDIRIRLHRSVRQEEGLRLAHPE